MHYNAACAYGLCAMLRLNDKPEPTDSETAEQQKYLELSLACLKEALTQRGRVFGFSKLAGAKLNHGSRFIPPIPKNRTPDPGLAVPAPIQLAWMERPMAG